MIFGFKIKESTRFQIKDLMSKTEILTIQHPHAIETAKRIIENHGTIAFPTDTVYGIAANAFSPEGIQKIYIAKQRSAEKALPVLIGDLEHLPGLCGFINERTMKIAGAFWPGALTLILPKGPDIPSDLTPYPTIGVRMPNHEFTLNLLRETGPLATTSANLSGEPNPTTAQEVYDQLDGHVDLILDGGPTPGPIASTVIDVSGPELKLLRQGPISLEAIQAVFH